MTITTPLPTPPQTSDPANFSTRADAWVAAMAVFQTELDAYAAGLSPLGRNMLINGAFQIDQRNGGASTATADDAYCFDRWYALTQTGTVAASQVTDPENGYTHALRLTQSQASAQRFGLAQIIEGKNCKFARGNSGTLVARVRCSASTTIRYAIIGWTGTEDAVTSDIVNSWTNSTFTAGQFFTSTTTSVLGTGSLAVTSATWTSLTALTASLGTSFNNIVVFVWTDSTQAQNVTLDFDYAQFEAGASANSFERRAISLELANCQRYYFRRFNISADFIAQLTATTGTNANGKIFDLPQTMRSNPTVAMSGVTNFSLFNPSQGSVNQTSVFTVGGSQYSIYTGSAQQGGAFWTAGDAVRLSDSVAGGWIDASAEL